MNIPRHACKDNCKSCSIKSTWYVPRSFSVDILQISWNKLKVTCCEKCGSNLQTKKSSVNENSFLHSLCKISFLPKVDRGKKEDTTNNPAPEPVRPLHIVDELELFHCYIGMNTRWERERVKSIPTLISLNIISIKFRIVNSWQNILKRGSEYRQNISKTYYLYSGVSLYISNAFVQSSSVIGGRTPVTGSHFVMDNPDSVNL